MPSSEAEARIRRLMSRIQQSENRTRVVEDQILRTRQNLAGFYQFGQGRCTTTITGTITGGLNTALAGSAIQVIGAATATDYGTFAAVSGAYSVALQLDPADTTLNLIAIGPGPRFAAGTPVAKVVTQCASNAVADIRATPASGYHYSTNGSATGAGCQYPLKDTLTFVDSFYGTFTINWIGGIFWNSACVVGTTPASTCPSVSTAMTFGLSQNAVVGWQVSLAGLCPLASTCPPASGVQESKTYTTVVSKTCPDNTPTLFDMTWSIPAGSDTKIHGAAAQTIRIYEV